MVAFGGFEMPVQYTSILQEHAAVREAAGLFDTSHMGQIALEGPAALETVEKLFTRPLGSLKVGRIRYGLLCNEDGGVVDDITCYRTAEDALLLCVNASNIAKDYAWLEQHAPPAAGLHDRSEETAMLALQGPASAEIMADLGASSAAELRRYAFDHLEVAGCPALVSRTGYTGEDGFELYCDAARAAALFEALLVAGGPRGLKPAGLGARDTLRLEAALPLYGHELDDTTSPLEAGLDRFVVLEGRDFVGAAAIERRRTAGAGRTLVGFSLSARGVARAEYPIARDGETVGIVTSGAPSPTLGKSIGLAYVPPALTAIGTTFDVLIRGRATPAEVVETPFVRAG